MKNLPNWILYVGASATLALFIIGVVQAARFTLTVAGAPAPDLMPEALSSFARGANAVLAAHLGAMLGLGTVQLVRGVSIDVPEAGFHKFVAVVYAITLLGAIAVWVVAGATDDPALIVPLLAELANSGIALLLAMTAAALGVRLARTAA